MLIFLFLGKKQLFSLKIFAPKGEN